LTRFTCVPATLHFFIFNVFIGGKHIADLIIPAQRRSVFAQREPPPAATPTPS